MKDIRDIDVQDLIKSRKLMELRELFSDWPIPDIADHMFQLERPYRVLLFRLLPRQVSSEVFSYLNREDRNALLRELNTEETKNLLGSLKPDDRTNLFEELPGQATQRLLNLLNPEDLKEACQLLGYPEESVGRLMTPNYVAVRPEWTIGQALRQIRAKGKDSETLNIIYVTDSNWELLDSLELHKFILSSPDLLVKEIMDTSFISLSAFDDREEAVHMMQRYDTFALPVVDSEGVLIGVVTFDDVMDVAQEEATEDFHKGAAVTPLKMSYQAASALSLYSKRIGWLIALVLVNLISLEVMASFEEVIASAIVLTFFLPMLTGSGGNVGSQSATLLVRALAIEDVQLNQWFRTAFKELRVGLMLGVTMGFTGFLIAYFRGSFEIAVIVGLSMVTLVIVANLIGMLLPFILTLLRLDPAVASNPLITSLTDVTGIIIYLQISKFLLGIF